MLFLLLVTCPLLVSVICLLCVRRAKATNELPPAAMTTPLIGCLPIFLSKNMGQGFLKIGKTHGPVVQTHLGFNTLILVNGVEAVRKAFKNPALSGRPDNLASRFFAERGLNGVIWLDEAKEQRSFVLKNTKHFEFSGHTTEANIQDEISIMLDRLEALEGELFQIRHAFNVATLSSVLYILLGLKADHSDPEFQDFVDKSTILAELPDPLMRACFFYPPLSTLLPFGLSGKTTIDSILGNPILTTIRYVKNHLQSRKPMQPRDFVDALADKVEATTDEASVFHSSHSTMVPILFDMCAAALETTSTTLEWAFLFLTQFPGFQVKLRDEIDAVIGKERFPSLSDRPSMPFCQAVLQEVFRMAPTIPIGFHKATEDTKLMGYTIKKDSIVFGNYYGIHMDPDLWKNPGDFNPERFLDKSGNFVKSDMIFTFGYGRRSCLGESIARDQIFLFVTRILQRFHVHREKELSDFDGNMAFGYHCVDFKAKFVSRVS